MSSKGPVNLDIQIKDIRRQLSDQLGCLEFRMESKLSLLQEYQEFFKKRGEVEYEYARSLERLCEKFERNTKQRNLRNEVRSTFNLWSTLLAETRKVSRERANLAEVMATEMCARLEVMSKDVQMLAKKCKEMCVEVQDNFLKEIRDLSEHTKLYQHSCHNTDETYNKLVKSREKLEGLKGARRKKAQEKDMERQRQFKASKHVLMKNRNDYLLGVSRCNSISMQYFNMDIMDFIEYMDFDYHDSFRRLVCAVRDAEYDTCKAIKTSADTMVEQTKTLNFEGDLHYFLSEYANPFTPPNSFQFYPFQGDDVLEYKVNTEDVFKRAKKAVDDLKEEIQTLKIQREEDVKTIQHMQSVNLKKYQVTTVDDALAVIEENGDSMPSEQSRGTASLERGLSLSSRGAQSLHLSQKGKKDTMMFTLGIVQRRIQRADRLSLASSQLDILEKALDEQKVPPVPVGVDAQGRQIPGEVPKLFGGDIVEYIMATGTDVPLIVRSCIKAIEENGMRMEGLFRVPGPAAYTDDLRKGFEEGRDPLAYSQQKPDICAVASTLKAYFRELSIPLFPSAKYRDFIECTRHDTVQDRIDAIRNTIYTLQPPVICVMKYLFRFLSRVALYSSDNKMGSANLALVFGPTLMRAPDAIDPRQLHTDVPCVNMLIQYCIDQNILIFGEEADEVKEIERSKSPPTLAPEPPSNLEASFELNSKVTVLATSPPAEPPTAPPTSVVPQPQAASEDQEPPGESEPSLPAPPLPPRSSLVVSEAIVIPGDDEPPPPRPPKSADIPPITPPLDSNGEELSPPVEPPIQPTPAPESCEVPVVEPKVASKEPSAEPEPAPEVVEPPVTPEDMARQLEDDLAKAMEEINCSLTEMEGDPPKPSTPGSADELSDEETDSEDEEVIMKVDAHALYDYHARSDKELSFKKGDLLQVVEKTPDHNWWDGFHDGKRGFIPVAYIEILELGGPKLAIPAPPERKSSMPVNETSEVTSPVKRVTSVPTEEAIPEILGNEVRNTEEEQVASVPDVTIQSPVKSEPPPTAGGAVNVPIPTIPVAAPTTPTTTETAEAPAPVERTPKEPAVDTHPSVRSLSKQFQEPPVQGKVLVEPHSTGSHRRQRSSDMTLAPRGDGTEEIPRSASTGQGTKVGRMASVFERPPPPAAPKPKMRPHASSNPPPPTVTTPGFHIVSHPPAGATGISPLQRIAHQGQGPPKPAISKPPPPAKSKDKGKPIKREKSLKEKGKDSKPHTAAKPAFVSGSREFNAELARKIAEKQEPK